MSVESDIHAADAWFIGEDKILRFAVVDANAAAVNITGWELGWVLRESAADSDSLASKSVGAGITITDGPGGICEVAITDADTDNLDPGTYVYALRRTDEGSEQVLAYGDAVLRQAA